MIGLGITLWKIAIGGGALATPGGSASALLLENGNGFQLEDGSGVLLLEA